LCATNRFRLDPAQSSPTTPDRSIRSRFSPDARRLASASHDKNGNGSGTWRREGKCLCLRGHGDAIRSGPRSPRSGRATGDRRGRRLGRGLGPSHPARRFTVTACRERSTVRRIAPGRAVSVAVGNGDSRLFELKTPTPARLKNDRAKASRSAVDAFSRVVGGGGSQTSSRDFLPRRFSCRAARGLERSSSRHSHLPFRQSCIFDR